LQDPWVDTVDQNNDDAIDPEICKVNNEIFQREMFGWRVFQQPLNGFGCIATPEHADARDSRGDVSRIEPRRPTPVTFLGDDAHGNSYSGADSMASPTDFRCAFT
jgi:hypothetical protein